MSDVTPVGDLGATVAIRPERPADADPLRALLRAAFGVEKVVTLVDLIRASPGYLPDLSLVAEADGAPVGHVLLSRTTLRRDDEGDPVDVLLLSPLAVRPDVQGRGIGGALVRAAVAAARERGESLVALEGDPALYRRFGFRRSSEQAVRRPSPLIPEEGFQVLALDAAGARLRGTVEYTAPFWDADCVGP